MTTPRSTQNVLRAGQGSHALLRALKAMSESRVNYWLSYVADFSLPVLLLILGVRLGASASVALISLCAGVFAFTWVEYAMHRWLFHSVASFMSPTHRLHHDAPTTLTALPFFTGALGTALWWAGIAWFVPPPYACFFLSGLSGAYAWYGLLHHLQHHATPRTLPSVLHKRRALHVIHHRLETVNFGVTTSFWDHLLGTHHRTRKSRLD